MSQQTNPPTPPPESTTDPYQIQTRSKRAATLCRAYIRMQDAILEGDLAEMKDARRAVTEAYFDSFDPIHQDQR